MEALTKSGEEYKEIKIKRREKKKSQRKGIDQGEKDREEKIQEENKDDHGKYFKSVTSNCSGHYTMTLTVPAANI